jgi:hypothetical protein
VLAHLLGPGVELAVQVGDPVPELLDELLAGVLAARSVD